PRAMRTGIAWSRDDRTIAFGKDAAGNEQHDIYAIDVATGAVTQLTNDPAAEEHAVEFSPDDEWLTVITNKRNLSTPERPGAVRGLAPEGVEEIALRVSEQSGWVAACRNTDSSISPVLYDVESGRARELQLPAGVAFGAQFFDGDRKLLLQYTTDTNRASLVAYDLERDTFESVLEPEYGMIDRSVFVKTEHVWYPSSD